MKRSYSYILSLLAILLTVSGINSLGVLANPQLAQHEPKDESKHTELTLKKDSTEIVLPLDQNEELDFSLVHTLEYEEDASLPFIKKERDGLLIIISEMQYIILGSTIHFKPLNFIILAI